MSAALQRCWLMSGHVASLVPGHTHTLSSCDGEEGARRRAALPCPVPTNPHPQPTVAPGRETNCECYWLPQQICAVRRVNKMDGVVSLSSGKVLWRGAPGRVQHRAGSQRRRTPEKNPAGDFVPCSGGREKRCPTYQSSPSQWFTDTRVLSENASTILASIFLMSFLCCFSGIFYHCIALFCV